MKDKVTWWKSEETQIIPESIESLLVGRNKLNYSVRSYTVNELQGELTMFSLYQDYRNPHYTQYRIKELLKEIKGSHSNHSYLKIHKNLFGELIWVDTSPKNNKQRTKEKKKYLRESMWLRILN